MICRDLGFIWDPGQCSAILFIFWQWCLSMNRGVIQYLQLTDSSNSCMQNHRWKVPKQALVTLLSYTTVVAGQCRVWHNLRLYWPPVCAWAAKLSTIQYMPALLVSSCQVATTPAQALRQLALVINYKCTSLIWSNMSGKIIMSHWP